MFVLNEISTINFTVHSRNLLCQFHLITILKTIPVQTKRIVIFASGSGTNAENLITFFHDRDHITVIQVLTNNPHAKVLDRAKHLKVSALSFNKVAFTKTDDVLNISK